MLTNIFLPFKSNLETFIAFSLQLVQDFMRKALQSCHYLKNPLAELQTILWYEEDGQVAENLSAYTISVMLLAKRQRSKAA